MRLRTRLVLLAFGLVAFAGGCGGGGTSDPETARCENPNPTSEDATKLGDHREIALRFTCEGAVIAGTLYLPSKDGRYPAVVWVHGSGEQPRLPYEADIVAPLVEDGIAVFSYDKRGVGESEGACCTDPGQYNLVAADADGAVLALRSRADIDATRVGFYGVSEAGWVVPLANSRLREPVAFTALVSAPTVTTGEEEVWSDAAGEDEPEPLSAEKKAEATRRLEEEDPSGFDPAPYIGAAADARALALRRWRQVDPHRPLRGDPQAAEASGQGLHVRRLSWR
jgi:pimeloyl-ACP methyl ester carboxylesterase